MKNLNSSMKKRIVFITGLFLVRYSLWAQSVSPDVFATAGGNALGSNVHVSWTLGETMTAQLTSSTVSLSQGFQQNFNICVSLVNYQYAKAGNPYQVLFPLANNMVISQIPEQVTILATDVCTNVAIESFEMAIQGPGINWTAVRNVSPASVFETVGTTYSGRNFVPGSYTLTVTGYGQTDKGGGITYGPVVTNFLVVGNLATILTPMVSSNSLCAGSTVNVSFEATGTFNEGNGFQVQLSQPNGSFESPTVLGTRSTPGVIVAAIPANLPEGNNYLIRVVSTNQVLVSNPTISVLQVSQSTKYLNNPTDNITGTTDHKASSTIIANNLLQAASVVNYQAGNAIILNSGFETKEGAVFKAEIKTCTN